MNSRQPLWATCALLNLRSAASFESAGDFESSDACTARAIRIAKQHSINTNGLESQLASAIDGTILPAKRVYDDLIARQKQSAAGATPAAVTTAPPSSDPQTGATPPEMTPQQESPAPTEIEIEQARNAMNAAMQNASQQGNTILAQSGLFTDPPTIFIWPMNQVGGWGQYDHEGNYLLIAEEAIGHNLQIVLRHELTHALEYVMSGGRAFGTTHQPLFSTPVGKGDPRYFRQGHEVRAFAATVVEALKVKPPSAVLQSWAALEPFLRRSPDYVEAEQALRGKPTLWKLFHQAIYGLLANDTTAA